MYSIKRKAVLFLAFTLLMLICGGCKKETDIEEEMMLAGGAGYESSVADEKAFGVSPESAASYTIKDNVLNVVCAPSGICAMNDGTLLVTDTYNKVIWQVRDGECTVFAGGDTIKDIYDEPVGGYNDARFDDSFFACPWGIAPFMDGWVVSDAENNALRYIADGTVQTVNATTEELLERSAHGVIYSHPTGLAGDDEGNLYVSDTYNGAIRCIEVDGIVSTYADGLNDPTGICWKDGVLFVAETGANRIVKIANGKTELVAGSGDFDHLDGRVRSASFCAPQGIAVDIDGTIYVADTGNGAIRKIADGKVTTVVQNDAGSMGMDIIEPIGLFITDDRLLICDSFVRKVYEVSLPR